MHPFKTINYYPKDYKCWNIFELNQLQPYVKKRMVKQYRELFYNFNQYENIKSCPLCDSQNLSIIIYN